MIYKLADFADRFEDWANAHPKVALSLVFLGLLGVLVLDAVWRVA